MAQASPCPIVCTTSPVRVTRLARALCAVLGFFLIGCATEDFVHQVPPINLSASENPDKSSPAPAIPEPSAVSKQTTEDSSKPTPARPSPRTFPQAFRAYLHCLCYGPPVRESQPISQAAEQEQSKNPP